MPSYQLHNPNRNTHCLQQQQQNYKRENFNYACFPVTSYNSPHCRKQQWLLNKYHHKTNPQNHSFCNINKPPTIPSHDHQLSWLLWLSLICHHIPIMPKLSTSKIIPTWVQVSKLAPAHQKFPMSWIWCWLPQQQTLSIPITKAHHLASKTPSFHCTHHLPIYPHPHVRASCTPPSNAVFPAKFHVHQTEG